MLRMGEKLNDNSGACHTVSRELVFSVMLGYLIEVKVKWLHLTLPTIGFLTGFLYGWN